MAPAKIAVASFSGGFVRLYLRPIVAETFPVAIFKSVWLLLGCLACGFYAAPVVNAWLGIDPTDENKLSFMAALVGFVGLSVAAGVLKGVDNFDFGNLLRFFIKDGGAK